MRRHLVLLAVLVLLVSVVVAAPAAAKKDNGLKDRPFKASADVIWSEWNPGACDGAGGTDSYSTGTGTHLGRFELFETLCESVEFPILTFTVDGLLIAANGDELRFDVLGTFNLATLELIESSGWVFDGGTGRFASASGVAFETLFRDDVAPFPIVGIDAVGWIVFDASDRSR